MFFNIYFFRNKNKNKNNYKELQGERSRDKREDHQKYLNQHLKKNDEKIPKIEYRIVRERMGYIKCRCSNITKNKIREINFINCQVKERIGIRRTCITICLLINNENNDVNEKKRKNKLLEVI